MDKMQMLERVGTPIKAITSPRKATTMEMLMVTAQTLTDH